MSITKHACVDNYIYLYISDKGCESVINLGDVSTITKSQWSAFIEDVKKDNSSSLVIGNGVKRMLCYEEERVVIYVLDHDGKFISWTSLESDECIPAFEDLLKHLQD